jgi:negative regulator of flagellin synthesis FlgM
MVDSVNNSVRMALNQQPTSSKNLVSGRTNAISPTGDGVDSLASKDVVTELTRQPPLDLEAVNRIKAAIKRGEYPINLDAVAEELMNSYIEMKT